MIQCNAITIKVIFIIIIFVSSFLSILSSPPSVSASALKEYNCTVATVVTNKDNSTIVFNSSDLTTLSVLSTLSCQVALFSSSVSFNVTASLHHLPTDSFCDTSQCADSLRSTNSGIAVVNRGSCSFEIKARNAIDRGYAGLVIVNNANEAFPMGSQSENYHSSIPIVMVSNRFIDFCTNDSSTSISISFTSSRRDSNLHKTASSSPPSSSSSLLSSISFEYAILTALITLLLISIGRKQSIEHNVSFVMIILLFVLLRLGTFRINYDNTTYQHNETDEKIFETLVDRVSTDIYAYRLSNTDIERYRLSRDNYNDGIFIHPPMYVYLSMLLIKYGKLSFAAVSVMYHFVTLVTIPIIVSQLNVSQQQKQHQYTDSVSSLAMLLYSICPIALFCSQKYWIDNCLVMTVTVATAVHMLLINRSMSSSSIVVMLYSFTSGITYCLLVLYTKVTGLAILPCLLVYTCLQYRSSNRTSNTIIAAVIAMILGVIVAYAPWCYLYYYYAGRLLPNSWPSQSMKAGNAFIMKMVNKPCYTYVKVIATIAPIYLIGLVHSIYAYVQLVRTLFTTIPSSSTVARSDDSVDDSIDDSINDKSMISAYATSIDVLFLSLPAWGLLSGLSLLGALGAGYQTRFLLPCLPALCIASSLSLHHCFISSSSHGSINIVMMTFAIICICIGCFHALYYGVMFTPLYADIDAGILHVVYSILTSACYRIESSEVSNAINSYISHYGIVVA